jgi:hypothetical protein
LKKPKPKKNKKDMEAPGMVMRTIRWLTERITRQRSALHGKGPGKRQRKKKGIRGFQSGLVAEREMEFWPDCLELHVGGCIGCRDGDGFAHNEFEGSEVLVDWQTAAVK